MIEAKHRLVVFDQRKEAREKLVVSERRAAFLPRGTRRPSEEPDGETALAAG